MNIKAEVCGSLCIALLVLLWPRNAMAAEQPKGATTGMQEFQAVYGQIVRDEGEGVAEYEHLRTIYSTLEGMERMQASQLLSMTDAVFGRYQDAENHYYAAFPAGKKPGECPVADVMAKPAIEVLRKVTADAQIVMINESHSIAATRAFLVQLVPTLRQLGFKYLAMEAIAPASDELINTPPMKALQDISIPSRGYPLDQSSAGFYLREPIYAELVREAIAHGFKLVAYETLQAKSRDEREDGQAKALAKLIAADPEAKIAVIAGYSHIWKADGWMADRLQKEIGRKVLSIDQTSRVLGCAGRIAPAALDSYILTNADGRAWSSMPDRVDVTVLHAPREDGRTIASGWLTLGGRRKGVQPDITACADAWPCLISAIYADEDEQAVPADRVLLEGANDESLLFLKPGTYRYIISPHGRAAATYELTVR